MAVHRTIAAEVLSSLPSGLEGLTTADVAQRLQQFGPNAIVERVERPWFTILRDTLRDPMILFLFGTGGLYALLGERTEAYTLWGATVPLLGMDAFLHRRTQASLATLRQYLADQARVLRDDTWQTVPALNIVPGDLVEVTAGAPFPADGVVIGGTDLQVEEAILSGESLPVRKVADLQIGGAPLPTERWVFAGTRLLTGTAQVRVIGTGVQTQYGAILQLTEPTSQAPTPLQQALVRLVSRLTLAAVGFCVILAVAQLLRGHTWIEALISALTLAVAAIPEEFPVVFTIFLSVGVFRLARRHAFVRRLVSVENIGRITCIASDKTGTITAGQLHLTHLLPVEDDIESSLRALAARAIRPESNDPLDLALQLPGQPAPSIRAAFPFTEERRTEVLLLPAEAVMKGAPENVVARCELTEGARKEWLAAADRLAGEGHKVIGLAVQPVAPDWPVTEEPQHGYRFAGLLAVEDPIRPEVPAAIAACQAAGIRVLMVTGDHPATARTIAAEVGLETDANAVLTGDEMEQRLGEETTSALEGIHVIARATPQQKLQLVQALQQQGELVAVTGDGVNDTPALQQADIGIAMGERGSQSAREIADIVLADDNFATIVQAVAEGQQLFRNLRLSFLYLLLIHIPLVLTAALVPLAGFPPLYLPLHIIWLELIIHPTALLVFQEMPATSRLAAIVRPVPRQATFFARADWQQLLILGGVQTLLIALAYWSQVRHPAGEAHGRALALAMLVGVSAWTTAALSGLRTVTARWVVACTALSALIILQWPPAASWMHVVPLSFGEWMLAWGSTGALSAMLFWWRRREQLTT